jgi:hypothetical protein
MANEYWVPVTDDGLRNTMKPDNLFNEGFSNGFCSVGMFEQNEMAIFRQPINHH